MRTLALFAAAGLLVAAAQAQLPEEQIHAAGLGAQKQVIDLSGTGNALMLGVVYLNGEYFVSAGGADKRIFVLDEDGNIVRDFPQPPEVTSTFGLRDGATDGYSLMFGWENGILVFDTAGNPVTTVMAANGPQPVTLPIVAASGVTTHRGIAYDPMANGGNGAFWIGNFGSSIVQIDLQGNVLNTLANNSSWSVYGLAWDPYTFSLWANSVPNAGEIAQIDPVTGATTGVSFSRNQVGSAQGGLSVAPTGEQWTGGGLDLIGLDQGTPDALTRYRLHLYTEPVRDGTRESRLLSATGTGTLDDEPIKDAFPGQTIRWLLATHPSFELPKSPMWTLMNMGPEAAVNGSPIRGASVPELVALTRFSDPPGDAMIFKSFTDVEAAVQMPSIPDLELVRIQALSVNPKGRAAITASNQLFFRADSARVVASASGSNSFNSNTASGFFQVAHRFGPSITSVTFDWVASSNPSQGTMRFDTNQTGMADRFDAGNSTVSGCIGTYRNGSDVATGLIYDGLNNPPASCDPTANSGWIGTNPGNVGDYRTVQFRFTPGSFSGEVFEVDIDTDGGAGITGAAMEGMVVTVDFENGSQVSGEFVVDPNTSNRSLIRFL